MTSASSKIASSSISKKLRVSSRKFIDYFSPKEENSEDEQRVPESFIGNPNPTCVELEVFTKSGEYVTKCVMVSMASMVNMILRMK